MSSSQTDSSSQPDRLSDLPEALLLLVLSFLPTRIAARTSLLSRHFRNLWKASPSLDLTFDSETSMANCACALLSRDPSNNPLLRLHLHVLPAFVPELRLRDSYLSSFLAKAHSLGLRHLNLDRSFSELDPLTVSTIFSIDSLLSLELPIVHSGSLPSVVNLPRLKTLSLTFYELECNMFHLSNIDGDLIIEDPPASFGRFLYQISSLEDLHLRLHLEVGFTLSSQTIRKLDLFIDNEFHQDEFVRLYMPSLEMLRLQTSNTDGAGLPHIVGIMPSLRKATLQLRKLHDGDVSVVAQLLSCVSSVEELRLDIVEDLDEKYPFPVLLKPRIDVPYFPNLKHLDVNMCFHEHNFESIISLLRHSPALESLKLVYEAPATKEWTLSTARKLVHIKSDGNHDCIHFRDLHLGQHGKEFMKLVRKRSVTINKQEEEANLLKNLVFFL